MRISMRKVSAIFFKDLKDMLKNINAIIMFALPLFFAIFYSQVPALMKEMGKEYLLMMVVIMNMCVSPLSLLPMIIAEEKEKNTLRTLMLSNVSGFEFIFGKVLSVFAVTEIVAVLLFVIIQMPLQQLPVFIMVTSLGSICLLMIGAVFGLLARDQMSTSVYSVIGMVIFMFPALFSGMNQLFDKVARFMPTTAVFELFSLMSAQADISKWFFSIAIIGAWTVISLVAFNWFFKKKGIDNL